MPKDMRFYDTCTIGQADFRSPMLCCSLNTSKTLDLGATINRTGFQPGEGNVSVATEILSLRRDRHSSVAALIAALDWQRAAQDDNRILARGCAVYEAADAVLLNVAAHASDAMNEPPKRAQSTRRSAAASRRRHSRYESGQTQQRRLFA